MKIKKITIFALLTTTLFIISACGGGGGGGTPPAAPTKAIVKLATSATSGTPPAGASIGGIDAIVIYPTNKGLSIADSDVVASGVAAGAFAVTNLTIPGQAHLINLFLTGIGFPTGEFVTLTFSIAPGNSPVSSDFTVAPGATIAPIIAGNQLTGLSVVIQSVTFQ